MRLGRIILALVGIACALYGFFCLVSPQSVAGFTGMVLSDPSAVTEVRAMYGGLQLGLGLLFIGFALRKGSVQTGLLILIVLMGSLALARLFGLISDGFSSYNLLGFVFESVSTILSVVALRQCRQEEKSGGD